MRISTYNPQVQGTQSPGPVAPGTPAYSGSGHEDRLAFSRELRRTGNVIGSLALKHQNDIRTNAIRSQRNNAMNAFDERRLAYQREYFSPDTAFEVDEETGELNYIRGLDRMSEEFNGFIENELSKGFTYSEAYETFRESADSKIVGFEHEMKVLARQFEIEWNLNSLQERADALQDQGDVEGLRDIFKEAAEGILSPAEASQQLNARTKQLNYNEVLTEIRTQIDAEADLQTILDLVAAAEEMEWENGSGVIAEHLGVDGVEGLDEGQEGTRRFGNEDLQRLRGTAMAEWTMHKNEKTRIQQEWNQTGHDRAQLLWYRQELTVDMLMDEENETFARMEWKERQYWIDRLMGEMQGHQSARGNAEEDAISTQVYQMLFAGEDKQVIAAYLLDANQQGLVGSTTYRTLSNFIDSNAAVDSIGNGVSIIQGLGKDQGMSDYEIARASRGYTETMIAERIFIVDDSGRVVRNPEADPHGNDFFEERARSYVDSLDWNELRKNQQTASARNDGAFRPGDLSATEAMYMAAQDGWAIHLRPGDVQAAHTAITQLEQGSVRIGRDLFGQDPVEIYRDRNRTPVLVYNFDVPIPANPASGDLPGATRTQQVEIRYAARATNVDEDGNVKSAELVPHVRTEDAQGNSVWRPMENPDQVNAFLRSMRSSHTATPQAMQIENTRAAREGTENVAEIDFTGNAERMRREEAALIRATGTAAEAGRRRNTVDPISPRTRMSIPE